MTREIDGRAAILGVIVYGSDLGSQWNLPYFEGVYHTKMIETYLNVNAHMVLWFILRTRVYFKKKKQE